VRGKESPISRKAIAEENKSFIKVFGQVLIDGARKAQINVKQPGTQYREKKL
jgi:hypothetical protein